MRHIGEFSPHGYGIHILWAFLVVVLTFGKFCIISATDPLGDWVSSSELNWGMLNNLRDFSLLDFGNPVLSLQQNCYQ
jgi:hypothetical protein